MKLCKPITGQESLIMLKMLTQSKQAYAAGHYKSAKKAFSDIRKKIKNEQA